MTLRGIVHYTTLNNIKKLMSVSFPNFYYTLKLSNLCNWTDLSIILHCSKSCCFGLENYHDLASIVLSCFSLRNVFVCILDYIGLRKGDYMIFCLLFQKEPTLMKVLLCNSVVWCQMLLFFLFARFNSSTKFNSSCLQSLLHVRGATIY